MLPDCFIALKASRNDNSRIINAPGGRYGNIYDGADVSNIKGFDL
jgi:hypothetical protein